MKIPAFLKPTVVAATFLLLASGCVYSNVQVPLDENYDKTQLGTKVGRASNHTVMWLVAWGDGGTQAAAKNGDIKVIQHADRHVFLVLFGLYTKATTVLYGE
jgi:hypothetical protein